MSTSPLLSNDANHTLSDIVFLETAYAQTMAGIFVWLALIITCHQVN